MLELRGMALMARTLSDTAKRCQARGREGPDWCDASFARFQFRPVPAHEWSAEAITLKANWINMYDKHGCVLGVETVINDPYEFKVRRRAGRRGRRTLGWHHLPKGVAVLPRTSQGSTPDLLLPHERWDLDRWMSVWRSAL